MRIVVAPDSYKGSASAQEVSLAVERGILRVFPHAEVVRIPISDGGEGLVDTLVEATGGTPYTAMVTGPLGEPVQAPWGMLGDGVTAVAEMASASGLPLVPQHMRDPRITCTFGTGELLRSILDTAPERIVLGIGGSATNDGGVGALTALGALFLDKDKVPLSPGGAALADLAHIELSAFDKRLYDVEIIIACDVDNPLCGPRGASAVFGPQKGACESTVELLDKALHHYGTLCEAVTERSIMETPGAGAAGGLGAGLLFFTNATLRPGIEVVLEATNFVRQAANADLIIVGEGHTDFQTAYGKAPVGVAKVAKKLGVPVICLSGGLGKGYQSLSEHGIDASLSCSSVGMSLDECMARAPELIEETTEQLFRILQIGKRL